LNEATGWRIPSIQISGAMADMKDMESILNENDRSLVLRLASCILSALASFAGPACADTATAPQLSLLG
jgi:hypothetical protein